MTRGAIQRGSHTMPVSSSAYAAIYRPHPDGSWTAELADLPDIHVKGADIDEVKDRLRASGRQHVRTHGENIPVDRRIVVGYVHLDERADDTNP